MVRKRLWVVLLTCVLCLGIARTALASSAATLTFSDAGITETTAGSGYTIEGTTLTISDSGVYTVTGSCSEGTIVVAKEVTDVTLILDDLSLTSSSTAPLVVKKSSTVNIHLEGSSTLTDDEDASTEDTSETFEGACVKVKSGSTVTFCGGGNLSCVANAKNGIKGGATTALIFNQSGKVTVSGSYSGYATTAGAVNNGIASDGSITFNQGSYDIDAAGDGIKSTPDATDETEGTTFDGDSAGAVIINGGTFDIDVDGDGIQADTNLTIADGTIDIQTMSGYSTQGTKYSTNGKTSSSYAFDPDNMSCKAIKASGDRANEDEEDDFTPTITITGGTITINSADDAVHSDVYAVVAGGTFEISSGDDGMHADTSLILGTEDSAVRRDPDVTINYSYEGLEAGTIYLYQGRYYVVAKDDGINAAGGSSSGTDEGGNDGFRPGGGFPGSGTTGSSDYNLYIYGGDLYVNCDGDGLDSNGGLYLYGGQQAVFSMKSGGDNSAIDCDGSVVIDGATIITAGTAGMDGSAQSGWFGSNQKYKASTSSYSAGKVVNASAGSTVMLSYKLPKAVNYTMVSWPSSVSSSTPTIATASSVTACKGGSWSHSWNSGTETTPATTSSTGLTTYTCSACSATETQTIPQLVSVAECDHTVTAEEEEDEGYAVTFAGDSGVSSINVYYTQDYSEADETLTATGTTVSRSSDTGEPDSSGSGQVNFQVVLADGYSLSDISVEGEYKNLKTPSDTGQANTYRVTKVAGELTIAITTVQCEHSSIDEDTIAWTWEEDYSAATMSATCNDCGNTATFEAAVTSELTSSDTITFTATVTVGDATYTDTKTAAPFTATFTGDEGVDSVDVYYDQDYEAADESDVTTAVARDGDTGEPTIDGSGQLNFLVRVKDGYTLSSVTATADTYKNIKGPSDTGAENTYRITKVSDDTTVTIATTESGSGTDPETDTYSVTYAFVSGTDGVDLPEEVTALLPTDSTEYADGTSVTAATLASTEVTVDGGTWSFQGWDADSATISGANVTFTGTWTYAADEATTTLWERLSGSTRYDTMSAIVAEGFSSSEYAVLATGANFPDALVASSLAGMLECPVVLTDSSELSDQAATQLDNLGVSHVYVMGGAAAVSADVLTSLDSKGITYERVAGSSRQATSLEVMNRIDEAESYSETVVVATGVNFADALSIGPWCYATSTPILLTGSDGTLSDEQVSRALELGVDHIIIVGGAGVVSDDVISQLELTADDAERLSGSDRYATSAAIAAWELEQGMSLAHVSVATGAAFPDALAGAALCGANDSVLLLAVDGTTTAIDAVLTSETADQVELGYVLGGKAAVSEALYEYLESITE